MQMLPSRPLPPDIGYRKIHARKSNDVPGIDQWKVTDEILWLHMPHQLREGLNKINKYERRIVKLQPAVI